MARARRGRGEGGVYQRESDGLWVGNVSLGYDGNGRRKRKVVYGTTKKEVADKMAEVQAVARVGNLPDAGSLTVGQLLDRWLDALKAKVSAGTYEQKELKATRMKAGLLSAPVFCTRTGNYLNKNNVLRAFRSVVETVNEQLGKDPAAKLIPADFRFHDLRHTVASILLSSGHSLRAVSQRLGHSNPAMTLRVYAHCLPGDDGKLADGLGRMLG